MGPYLLDRVLGAISYNLAKCGTGKALLYHFVEALLQRLAQQTRVVQ